MSVPTHRPTRASSAGALLAAVAVVLVGGTGGTVALVVATAGMFSLGAALVRGSRGWAATGTIGLFVALVVAGLAGAGALSVLAGTAATMVAWDLSEHAIGLGEQLGRAATTRRQEAVHAACSVGVGVLGVGLALVVTHVGVGALPVPAFVVGLVASIAFLAGLRT
jgi:hypothetical protein